MENFDKRLAILLCVAFILGASALQSSTITSSQTGNWSSTSTWAGGAVPTGTDDVVIAAGHTVTIDANGECSTLTIDGTLQFPDVTTYLGLTANADLTVDAGGTILAAPSGTNFGYGNFYLYGNLTILGSFNSVAGSGRVIEVYMYGGGKAIDASGVVFFALYIYVPGSSITVSNPFSVSGDIGLQDGTLDNSSHNITFGSSVTIDRQVSTASLTAAPVFSGTQQTCRYFAAMTTGYELPGTLYALLSEISGGGSVTLGKDVVATGYVGLSDYANNKIVTGSHTLTASGNAVYVKDNTTYIVGNLAFAYSSAPLSKLFPVGTATAYRPVTVNVTSLAGSGTVTVSQTDGSPASNSLPGGVSKVSAVRYSTIAKSAGISSATADVTLNWGSDDGISTPAEMTVVHGNHLTGGWDVADNSGGFTGTGSSGSVTGKGFTSFGDFILGSTGSDNSLPVEISSFTASASGSNVDLRWVTATETKVYAFAVERRSLSSAGGQSFEWLNLGTVEGKGMSVTPTAYSFNDARVAPGKYLYRVKQVDGDGSVAYTDAAEVEVAQAPNEFTLSQNYPNPFNPTTTIEFTLARDGRVVLKVYDIVGREVATLVNENRKAGEYQHAVFDASRLPSGVYFASIQSDGKQLLKKMMLVK